MVKVANAKITAKVIKEKIKQLESQVLELSHSENPQVVALSDAAKIKKETLEDVLESLQGNHINLKI